MFLIVCGEDSTASRNYIYKTKSAYTKKMNRVVDLSPQDLEDDLKNEADVNLFGEPTIYFTSGIIPYWTKKKKKVAEQIKLLADNQAIKVINWENGKSMYDLKLKASPLVKEFKLDTSLFDLQDALLPGKKEQFIKKLHTLADIHDPFFLYTLIHKHSRTMLLLKTGQTITRINPYVKQKAASQARNWDEEKLKKFYLGLTKIDQSIKTSGTPYTIPQSLEILACYYL